MSLKIPILSDSSDEDEPLAINVDSQVVLDKQNDDMNIDTLENGQHHEISISGNDDSIDQMKKIVEGDFETLESVSLEKIDAEHDEKTDKQEDNLKIEEVFANSKNLVENDVLQKLKNFYEQVTDKNNEWSLPPWMVLMNEVQKLPILYGRPFYEIFLDKYPVSGHWWKCYAEHELKEKNFGLVREILKRSLVKIRCPSIELWQFYLNFTRVIQVDVAQNSGNAIKIQQAKSLMCDAFELALSRVGTSIYSSGIWQAYIQYLKLDPNPQTIFHVRKVYQRALSIPMTNLDNLWKDYDLFEKSIPNNAALAQNLVKTLRPKLEASKAIFRDRKKHWDGLNFTELASPAKQSEVDEQLTRWLSLIEYELTNPERLDPQNFRSRLRLVFEQCLSCKRFYPEVWYQYAIFESDNDDRETAKQVFKRAIETLPDSCFLNFAYADYIEILGETENTRDVYETMLEKYPSSMVYINYMRFCRRSFAHKGLDEARLIFKRARKDKRENACTHHVYTASALMEYYSDPTNNGKTIALNIFELGLRKHIKEPDYVLSYLNFLIDQNDDNNTRSLFEKALQIIPEKDSRSIYNKFLEFEHKMSWNGGDLETVSRLEGRRAEVFPNDTFIKRNGILRIIHRYSYLNTPLNSNDDRVMMERYDETPKLKVLEEVVQEETITKNLPQNDAPEDMPEFLHELTSLLPLNHQWKGSIADPNYIVNCICAAKFPDREEFEKIQKQQEEIQLKDNLQSTQEEHLNANVITHRPVHDVFRSRQQQKLAKA